MQSTQDSNSHVQSQLVVAPGQVGAVFSYVRECSGAHGRVIYNTATMRRATLWFRPKSKRVMGPMYYVFRRLENNELIHVASRDQLEQAVELVEALREGFPGEYVVRDSEENDIDPPQKPSKSGVRPNTKQFDKHKSHRQFYY